MIESRELTNPDFVANPPNRCYYCKRELFSQFIRIAEDGGYAAVLDGTNADDLNDVRPGRKAAKQLGIRSPLLAVGLTKDELRTPAMNYVLPIWNKPAAACPASRVPYGVKLTQAMLGRIDIGERLLMSLGFTQVRVRSHGPIARIEIDQTEFPCMIEPDVVARILYAFQLFGFKFVTLDLAGYQTGSMNRSK